MQLAITGELGRFEEFFSEVVYPLWPLWLVALLIVIAALAWTSIRMGWHRIALRHRIITGAATALILAVTVPAGYYTVSPLFERETVCEASPITGAGAGSEACHSAAVAATASPNLPPHTGASGNRTPAATGEHSRPRVVASGEFTGADDFHFGEGQALLIENEPGKYLLRFEDFSVRNGPDLFVYLFPNPEGFDDSAINLGALKGTDGAFNYEIPDGVDIADFNSAVVWCRQFEVLFASARFGG